MLLCASQALVAMGAARPQHGGEEAGQLSARGKGSQPAFAVFEEPGRPPKQPGSEAAEEEEEEVNLWRPSCAGAKKPAPEA